MVNSSPLIGIALPTDYFQRKPLRGNSGDYRSVLEIKSALEMEGARTRFLFPGDHEEIDALVLPGGGDVDPSHYGQALDSRTGELDAETDRHQLAWARYALSVDLPVLGICRGMQVMNVAAGGDLIQHLEGELIHDPETVHLDAYLRRFPVHRISLDQNSSLGALFGTESLEVNSVHHQGVHSLGRRFRATAWADDGLVEAFESDGGRQVGVQFHPEDLRHSRPVIGRLFSRLAELASGVA